MVADSVFLCSLETSIPPASKTPSIIQAPVTDDTKPEEEAPEGPPPPPLAGTPVEDPPPCGITEHMIPSESAPLNSPVLETAAEILLEKFYPTSPEDVSAPDQPCGMPDTHMEVVIPDSPTVSIAALFEDHTVVAVVEEEEGEEEAHGEVEEDEGAGDNAFLPIESEHSDRGDLRGCESGGFGDGSSFPTAMCHVEMKETREGEGEDLAAEKNAIGDCQVREIVN